MSHYQGSKKLKPVPRMIIGIILIIGGYFAVQYGQKTIDHAQASLNWPSVEGTIVNSEVVRSRKAENNETTQFSAEIVFSYTVNGQNYQSSKRRIGATYSSSNSSGAYKVVSQYPVGKLVEVYYDSTSPEDAVLERGVFLESKICWYVGVGLIILGFLVTGAGLTSLMKGENTA